MDSREWIAERREMFKIFKRTTDTLVILVAVLLVAACGSGANGGAAGGNSNLKITLLPVGNGKAVTALTVQVADKAGKAVTNAAVSLEGNMSHAGMSPVEADSVHDGDDGASDGQYTVPFAFTMLGDWVVTAYVKLPDGTVNQQDIAVGVSDAGVEIK
jgi:hypothetical protein